MRVSLSIDPTNVSVPTIVAVAGSAEALGFHAVYCYDHMSGYALGGSITAHVWTVLGAIAHATRTVDIGSLVANVTARPAVDIAQAASTLHDLSGGRFVLGLGAGASGPSIWAEEMRMFAMAAEPSPSRRERVAETISFLRALWAGAPTFAGRWASFDNVRGIVAPQPLCPIIVGANGPKMAAVAAEHADGVNFHSWQPDLAELVATTRAAARRREAPFLVSVEAPLTRDSLDPTGELRERSAALAVDELVLAWRHDRPLPPTL